ncbi:hypothetical protein EG68_07656 [Paragonimus skrjabini miyazakii]|uniref:Ubiquitin-like domain-containing protein n=1 Tax=Paragonimus skrjabini miyazakii TaxID=59628 RepID=A0A8S9YPP4_9TREM|nr:hypothetical protein EG68_07656 [Paragonimus skrjabini miyazakii]
MIQYAHICTLDQFVLLRHKAPISLSCVKMRLFVRGCDSGTTSLEVLPNQTVSAVKHQIENSLNIAASVQRLAYAGIPLPEDARLDDYDIGDCACVELNCDLMGGAKKRKKKVYSTPKKIKHKRKKVKLATLKFYKIDSNGKITRLRRECTNKKCGAGVFMASHFDRHYCGKCGLTYMHEAK